MAIDPHEPGATRTASTELDVALLALVQFGDEQAMARLFERYSGLVFSVALRVLHDSAAAEDVMQEVFMQIWSKPTSFTGARGTLCGWLAVVARNRAIDLLRNRRSTDRVEDVPLVSGSNVADDAERNITAERMRTIIAELPAEQRTALDMAFFEGLTHVEIAKKTGCPLGTVKTRIRCALKTLGKAFKL